MTQRKLTSIDGTWFRTHVYGCGFANTPEQPMIGSSPLDEARCLSLLRSPMAILSLQHGRYTLWCNSNEGSAWAKLESQERDFSSASVFLRTCCDMYSREDRFRTLFSAKNHRETGSSTLLDKLKPQPRHNDKEGTVSCFDEWTLSECHIIMDR